MSLGIVSSFEWSGFSDFPLLFLKDQAHTFALHKLVRPVRPRQADNDKLVSETDTQNW